MSNKDKENQQESSSLLPPPSSLPARESSPLTTVTFALVLVLAFLLASSPMRNSDFWLHLAGGKLSAEGSLSLATDPFCYAACETTWVNHSWLFDLLLYGLFQLVDGTLLAVLKALTAAGLAAVLIFAGRKCNGWTVSLACTALAFVALSPWLTLRPSLFSCLFLALTIWVLEHQKHAKPESVRDRLKGYWPIPVLFALWVNVDGWFFLGPLVVGLYCVGAIVGVERNSFRSEQESERNELRSTRSTLWHSRAGILAMVLLLGLGACLLNPSFTRVFQIGGTLGLTDSADLLREDPQLRLLLGPKETIFSPDFFRSGPRPENRLLVFLSLLPGLAFWFLVMLGLVSFALKGKKPPWDRLLAWLSLFFLCTVSTKALPFFCVAAGPIIALNWSAFRARRLSHSRGPSAWDALGRGAVFLAILLLLATAWPGWLQNAPGPRRWALEMEPSLAAAGKQIAKWRNEGVLEPGHHGFHFSPEAANIFAWLCPEEKGFLNAHRNVPAQAVADYIAVRNGLLGKDNDWRSILRRRHISHVVLYNNDQRLTERAIQLLMAGEEEWRLVYQQGRVAIFAKTVSLPALKPVRLAQRAFSLKTDDRAPGTRPKQEPAPFHWWDAWWRPRPDRSLDADEARQEVALFQASGPVQFKKIVKAWLPLKSSRYAGMVAAAGSPAEFLFPVQFQEQLFFSARDLGPPAPLYLAIRAARRALHVDPDSVAAYLDLGDAYFLLAKLTRERTYQFPLFVQMRTIQAVAAYQQALVLKPGLETARFKLVELYQAMGYQGYLDLMLQELQENFKRRPALSDEAKQMAKNVEAFAQAVKKSEDDFALAPGNLKVLERARLALKLGLAGTALKTLLASDISAIGPAGLDLELRLLLETGRIEDVRDWLKPYHEKDLGTSLYYLVRAKGAAASGDYDQADQDLQASVLKLSDLVAKEPLSLRDAGAFMVGNAVLSGASGGPFTKFSNEFLHRAPLKKKTFLPEHYNAPRYLFELDFKLAEEAKINVLRGMLALEAGQMAKAQRLFTAALAFWQSQGGMIFPDPESLSSRLVAQQWLGQMKKKE